MSHPELFLLSLPLPVLRDGPHLWQCKKLSAQLIISDISGEFLGDGSGVGNASLLFRASNPGIAPISGGEFSLLS